MEYELYHHGILGMHWGIRRYQNKDGTWTAAGKKRYGDNGEGTSNKKSSGGGNKKSRMQRAASYNKAYDEATRDKEKADAANAKMKKLYEGLAKTKIGRIREVTKNGNSEKVKAYNKAYNEAVRAQEKADSSNKKMKSSYKDLGKTAIGRMYTAVKYRNADNKKVSDYDKKYNEAVRTKEKADAANAKMKKLYEGLAKTKIGRIREVTKNGNSEKVKAYIKAYNEAVRAQEKADSSNKKMKSSYKKLKK